MVRVSDIVCAKLNAFSKQGGASFIEFIQPCLDLYVEERAEAQREIDEIASRFPESVISHQIEVSDRIARVFQNEAVEELVSEGAISNSMATQLIQPV